MKVFSYQICYNDKALIVFRNTEIIVTLVELLQIICHLKTSRDELVPRHVSLSALKASSDFKSLCKLVGIVWSQELQFALLSFRSHDLKPFMIYAIIFSDRTNTCDRY